MLAQSCFKFKKIIMKKSLFLAAIVIIGVVLFAKKPEIKTKIPLTTTNSEKPKKTTASLIEKKSIFVPDWTLGEKIMSDNVYDRRIYFGSETKQPENILWVTYKVNSVEELNQLTIKDSTVEGIVLDLEISGLATEDLINQINRGVEKLYIQVKEKNLKLALALYGDLFYRQRPYDLKTLNQFSDEIMVMAYDFHKSYGEPGANFPYQEFKKMIDDYLDFIPAEKLTIIFGMYGYDWTLKDGKPLKAAEALTLNQIKTKFSEGTTTDPVSKEKNINYKGEDGYDHVIFFEDEESAQVKTDYLKEKGIGSIAYWAWSYF